MRSREAQKPKAMLAICSAAVAIAFAAIALAPGIAAGARQTISIAPARPAVPLNAVPFRVGELLTYRVEWSAFSNAASAELSVPERRNLYGWSTWHFRAAIHTLGSVRSLFEIDDQFDSYADASSFETRQFEEYLSELGRKQNQVMRFAATGEALRGRGSTVVVLPGTHDPLDALYNLRAIDWDRTPEFRTPVYDGKEMYKMSARREAANEPVTVAAGQFSTSRISVQLFQYQLSVAGIHFEIWLANDAARKPVLIRADLPFGSVRMELISAKD